MILEDELIHHSPPKNVTHEIFNKIHNTYKSSTIQTKSNWRLSCQPNFNYKYLSVFNLPPFNDKHTWIRHANLLITLTHFPLGNAPILAVMVTFSSGIVWGLFLLDIINFKKTLIDKNGGARSGKCEVYLKSHLLMKRSPKWTPISLNSNKT